MLRIQALVANNLFALPVLLKRKEINCVELE